MSDRTFAFVDLAGFTALTDAHGDEAAARLAERFCELARQSLHPQVLLVKSIGDAVMLASPDPLGCLLTVEDLLSACLREPDFPVARAGAHTGSAVERDGDWFGSAVNIAARVCALAAGRQLLITAPVAAVARQASRTPHDLGLVSLRGIARPVGLFSVDVGPTDPHTVTDPVCRMHCDTRAAAGTLRHADQDWWFCSLRCAGLFTANPDAYIGARSQ